MLITPINLYKNNVNYTTKQPGIKYNNVLTKDTVCFTASTFKDSIEKSHERNMEKYMIQANLFFDVLDAVADELKDNGISFDREYAMQNPVKSAESVSSKVARSKSFDVPDLIRTTLYIKNIYDKNLIFNKLLPAMEKRGYVLARVKNKPDIDFRFGENASSSGYEDIQMRFVNIINPKNKTKHELIILFGPNYANAKHEESEKVYNFTRQAKELHINFNNAEIGSPEFKIKRYIELINTMFANKISKKLFDNAKNKDFYNIDEAEVIEFTEEDEKLLRNYFEAIKDRTRDYYKRERSNTSDPQKIKELNKDLKSDLQRINNVQENLKKTISYFKQKQQ